MERDDEKKPLAGTPPALRPPLGTQSRELLVLQGAKGIARRRGVSLRTVQRRLADAGFQLTEIQEISRKELLLELMRGELPMSEVATRLGLSGPQVLCRYVKRVFGVTPTQLRKSLASSR